MIETIVFESKLRKAYNYRVETGLSHEDAVKGILVIVADEAHEFAIAFLNTLGGKDA